MNDAARRYTKRPVEIEAMQVTPDAWQDVQRWVGGASKCVYVGDDGYAFSAADCGYDARVGIEIPTLEGTMLAVEDDWVIRGVQGEFYPCKPSIFAATYKATGHGQTSPMHPDPMETTP